jgi:hypothetical protein
MYAVHDVAFDNMKNWKARWEKGGKVNNNESLYNLALLNGCHTRLVGMP